MRLLRDRRGIHTALIVALLLIVGLAVAAVVGHFAMMAGVSSARKAAFEIVGQPMISEGAKQLVFTVNNIGRSDATIKQVVVHGQAIDADNPPAGVTFSTTNIPRQARTTVTISGLDNAGITFGAGGLQYGDQVEVQVITDQGTFSFVAFVTE